MARTVKYRRICVNPPSRVFAPESGRGFIKMTLVELEALRLCDVEGLDQDAAASMMGVSRGTFQRILYAARKISAVALCESLVILISGGHYQSSGDREHCVYSCSRCPKADSVL